MAVKRVSPLEAKALLDEGYLYLDVRSVPEFEEGHPRGAHNAPLLHLGPAGMAPNPEFLAVVTRVYPKETRIVVGCRSGGRSQQAAILMEMAGFTQLVEMRGGLAGEIDRTGRFEPGWAAQGLPVSTVPAPGASWGELKNKK